MNRKNKAIIGIAVILMLGITTLVFSDNEDVRATDAGDPNNRHPMDSSGPAEKEKHPESNKTELSRQESEIIDYFEKTKNEILQGRKFSNQSTAVNALLTLISAYYHQDQDTLEQIFPIVRQKQFERLSSPETRSQMLAVARKSIFCRIEIENTPPEESDICAIYTSESPEKTIDQVWSFAYVEGAWRFAGGTGDIHNWSAQAKQAEALTRNILQSEAEKTTESTTDNLQQEARGQDDSEEVQGAPKPDESAINRVLSLDGEGDYVRVADSQSLHSFSDAITIEVWVKASSFYADDWAISSIVRKNVASGAENFLLRFRNIEGSLCVEMGLGEIGTLRAPYEFALNKWYHLAGTYDGRTITVFVNGLAVANQNISGRLYIDKSDLYIGKGDPEFLYGEYLHGELDEIRIWNVARSEEQIRAAMNISLSGEEEGLVAYWNFDDGTAKDLSPNGNDGLLNADAKIVESPRTAVSVPTQEQLNKLVAWWRLDEADGNDVADSSGNACGGKLIGNPQWRPAGGKVGGALEFDGDGDSVQIGNESAFDIAGPITVAAWIRVNVFDKRWQAIVTKGDTSWRLQRTAEEGTLSFHCTGITSITGQRPEGIEGNKNVNDGQWHHVVGVYDGAKVLLYVDGVPDNSSQASGSIQANDLAVTIGGNSEQAGREWNGLIDEPCVIAGAIDANGVLALYTGSDPITVAQTANPQLQGPEKLLAWWKFDNDANDSAGANHGTIHGNPAYTDGKVSGAISFDGDDYVDCGNPDSLNFGTGDWIISVWIKTTQSGTEPENRGTVFANGGDEEGGIRYALAVNEEYLGTVVLTTDNDTHKGQVIGKTTVNDGTWHHVVGNRSEGQLRVYVDGVLDGGSYLPAEYDLSGASQHNAYIGVITDHRDNSLFKYFVGLIDEVCVIRGSIDADGVRALYSGEDPVTVAKTAVITQPARAAVAEPQVRPQQVTPPGTPGGIEGDWQIISDQVSQKAVIEIRRESDGTLGAVIVAESPGETLPAIPLDEVTFENGKLRFEMKADEGDFEGTMKEDGLTIEGEFQHQEQVAAAVLKRIDIDRSPMEPASEEQQLQAVTGGKSNIAIALILVLALAGIVAGIVFFLVKSSIR